MEATPAQGSAFAFPPAPGGRTRNSARLQHAERFAVHTPDEDLLPLPSHCDDCKDVLPVFGEPVASRRASEIVMPGNGALLPRAPSASNERRLSGPPMPAKAPSDDAYTKFLRGLLRGAHKQQEGGSDYDSDRPQAFRRIQASPANTAVTGSGVRHVGVAAVGPAAEPPLVDTEADRRLLQEVIRSMQAHQENIDAAQAGRVDVPK